MITGIFLKGSPAVEIDIWGVLPTNKKKFTGIIDTGFTGFVQIPFIPALGLGLVLETISTFTLADGSSSSQLMCWGVISLNSIQVTGLISLSMGGQDVLLGTDWLEKMKLELRVDCLEKQVSLVNITPTPISPSELSSN